MDLDEVNARIDRAAAEAGATEALVDLVNASAILERAAAEAPTLIDTGDRVKMRFTLEGTCRYCGCTNERGCRGGCVWFAPDICSRCVPGRAAAPRRGVVKGRR